MQEKTENNKILVVALRALLLLDREDEQPTKKKDSF